MHSHDYRHNERRLEDFPKEQLCEPGASEETGQCPRKCGDAFVCEWSGWESVGSCSATCGTGTQKKVRTLQPRQLSDAEFASLQNVARLIEVNGMKHSPETTVVVSFACGVFSFALFMGIWQRCTSRSQYAHVGDVEQYVGGVYGGAPCQHLAILSPAKAQINCDNWAVFTYCTTRTDANWTAGDECKQWF